MLCWWVVGIQFSRLWWLVNEKQLDWILFCYAWEVPAVGWTGAVLIPWLRLRRLIRRLPDGDPSTGRRLARFPLFVVLDGARHQYRRATPSARSRWTTSPPSRPLEVAKIMIQGPALGGLFAVAAYLMAERAIQDLAVPPRAQARTRNDRVVESLYGKVFSIAVALTMGVAVPIVLHALTQTQLHREELRAHALADAMREASSESALEAALAPLGPNTYGFIVRRSNNFIIAGPGAGTVLYGRGAERLRGDPAGTRAGSPAATGSTRWSRSSTGRACCPTATARSSWRSRRCSDYATELAAEGRTSAAVALAALVIGLVLAAGLARSIVLPIDRLRAAAAQMARGELDVAPVGFSRGDEVAALAHAFDRMAVRVRTDEANLRTAYEQLQRAQSQALQHERLSAIGRVASGVAHELNNPLSAVLHLAEDLRADGARPAAEREALDTIADQARRCRTIVRDLLSFARGQERRPERGGSALVLARARAAAEAMLREQRTRLEASVAPDMPDMLTDASGLEQVLANLIVNAIHAAGHDGRVRVEGTRRGRRMAVRGGGQRARHSRRRAAADLRAVLHHQAARGRAPGWVSRSRSASCSGKAGRSGSSRAATARARGSWCRSRRRRWPPRTGRLVHRRRPAPRRAGGPKHGRASWWWTTSARSGWRSGATCGETAGRWTRRRTARPRWGCWMRRRRRGTTW